MRKIKITYNDVGVIRAVIENCYGIYDIHSVCLRNNIYDVNIIKIEWIQEANETNIVDKTQQL